ncbi:hypothetical protein [Pseudonocardia endophytica]|uniref:Uncharacterized protein n=1 Tax=Pseudonocardia endophytica TaxID=401976 RepID=A0A4R1HR74_PSEEN|nr:hypothetical protein [Pseudonocardia endophytica]TCK22269.1 hypothetical protein EV378_6270 [Pseudonocardia endophytica]
MPLSRKVVPVDALGPVLVGVYLIGILVSGTVIRARAGTGVWLRLKVFGPDGFGPVWIATATACSMAWPVTLAVWLARGRPEPRVVFNEKAEERSRRETAAAAAAQPAPPRPAVASQTARAGSVPPASPIARAGAAVVPPVNPVARIAPATTTVPTTSFGYTAPPDAVVDGWGCPNRDCGRGGPDVPQRWPHPCPGCGTATDPTFAEPWAHDARGPFLRAAVAGSAPAVREVWVGALAGWEHADALRRADAAAAERARLRARDVLGQVSEATAGSLQAGIVNGCLAHGLADSAADELLYWSARVRTAGAAADSGRRADCRTLMDGSLDFLESAAGAGHRFAPEIRRSALLLRSAVGDLLAAGVDERAARVLDGAPFPVAVPAPRTAQASAATAVDPAPAAAPPWPESRPARSTVVQPTTGSRAAQAVPPDSGSFPPPVARPVAARPTTRAEARSEDPDRVLAAVLGGVVVGSAPVLDAVRAWVPDGSSAVEDPAPADGPATIGGAALGRVRRGAGKLVGSSGPGTPDWAAAGPHHRAAWWSERMGAVVAAAVAAASSSGPVAEHASLRPAVSMAGQAFVLCAVAAEFGVADRDELVALLADVLFGRTPPASATEPDPGTLADVARRLDGTGAARVTAFTEIAWRLGRSLLTLRTELTDRPEPARRSRLGKVPGLGAVGGFLDERSALREVTASGVAWLERRSAPPGPPFGDPVSRSS